MLFNDHTPEITPVLINKVISGDATAFDLFYSLISGNIYAICLRYSANKEEASTIFQEIFYNIHSNILSYDFNTSFAEWSNNIAVKTYLQINKQQIAANFLEENREDLNNFTEVEKNSAFELLSSEALIDGIQELSLSCRVILNLYFIEAFTAEKISELLGISNEKCLLKIKQSKLKLKQKLSNKISEDALLTNGLNIKIGSFFKRSSKLPDCLLL